MMWAEALLFVIAGGCLIYAVRNRRLPEGARPGQRWTVVLTGQYSGRRSEVPFLRTRNKAVAKHHADLLNRVPGSEVKAEAMKL
jgi:hypothetical protein